MQHKFSQPSRHPAAGTRFNFFAGTKVDTKVQVPTPEALQASRAGHSQCTQFTCFTGTKVQILTLRACRRQGSAIRSARGALFDTGTKFTCFTGTKIQILTRCLVCHSLLPDVGIPVVSFTCFTGTKVQVLTRCLVLAQSVVRTLEFPADDEDASGCVMVAWRGMSSA